MEDIKVILGKRLKAELQKRGWTHAYLAQRLNTSRSNVTLWTQGKTAPHLDTLALIAAELGISPDLLIKSEAEATRFIPRPKPEDIVEDIIRTYGFVPPKRLRRPSD